MSSGSLEPLQNQLQRTGILRTSVNLFHGPLDNSAEWTATAQYYVNDLVLSPANGGAYVMIGGPDALTCVRGGLEPSVDDTGVWLSLATNGVSNYATVEPTVSAGGAGLYTVAATGTLAVPAGSVWLVTWQGTAQGGSGGTAGPAGTMTAADISTWTASSSGGSGTAAIMTVSPTVGVNSHSWGQSVVVLAGTGTPSIAVTGAYAGTVQGVTARVTYVRLA